MSWCCYKITLLTPWVRSWMLPPPPNTASLHVNDCTALSTNPIPTYLNLHCFQARVEQQVTLGRGRDRDVSEEPPARPLRHTLQSRRGKQKAAPAFYLLSPSNFWHLSRQKERSRQIPDLAWSTFHWSPYETIKKISWKCGLACCC